MATLSKKISQVLHVGTAPLTLSTLPSNVKSAIKLIRQVNAAGTGYASFNPASNVNSLTTAAAKTDTAVAQFIIETVSASPSVNLGVNWAFGIASSGGAVPPDLFQLDGTTVVAGRTVAVAEPVLSSSAAGSFTAAFSQGTGTVQVSFDNGASWTTVAATPVAVAANQTFRYRVQHAAGTAFFATLTLTYA